MAQSDGLMFLTPTAQGERLRQRRLFSGNPSPRQHTCHSCWHQDMRYQRKRGLFISRKCRHGKCYESSEILRDLCEWVSFNKLGSSNISLQSSLNVYILCMIIWEYIVSVQHNLYKCIFPLKITRSKYMPAWFISNTIIIVLAKGHFMMEK